MFNFPKMTRLVFVIGILFGLHFVSYPCVGKITAPPKGKNFTFLPRSTERITWAFDDDEGDLVSRTWTFSSSDGSKPEILAAIYGKTNFDIRNSSLPGTSIEPPGTLVLKDVDLSYNGTYMFVVQALATDTREVTVYIAVAPTVTLCSSSITVNESETITCLCTGQVGNPPATVTWYKNGKQIGGVGKEENLLTIRNVKKTDGGTYQCVAESHPSAKDEKSVVVTVNFSPEVTSFNSIPNGAVHGQSVTLICKADARPPPSYTMIHNDTFTVSTENMYIIKVVNYSHAGSYKCIAKNDLGNDSKNYTLRQLVPHEITTTATTRTTSTQNMNNSTTERGVTCSKSNCRTEWYVIVVTLLSGIIIGVLLSYIVQYFRRRSRNRKPQSTPHPQTSQADAVYQDLDVTKMNSEDNYQSLKVNSGMNVGDYENKNDSTYTELNKVRDVENNYQSLTQMNQMT